MRQVPLSFTGSAQELRRHSRRDLAINIVLGGLYTSVARRHVADYLASRTAIDGTAPVQVPVAKSRWPAILLLLAFVALRVADEFGRGPPLPVLIVAGVLLVPWFWATVSARTIAALRWRDLQLAFPVRWREVYLASWPVLVLGVAWAFVQPTVAAMAERGVADARVIAWAAVAAVVAFPLLAAQGFQWRRLRITRTRVGLFALEWPARFSSYLRLWVLRALGVLATAVAPVLLARHLLLGTASLRGLQLEDAVLVYVASIALVVLLATPARAWYEARMFVLAWDGVRAPGLLRVECALDARAFVRLRTADTWRTLWTLGAHRSRAVVNAYEAKLAAIRLHTSC